jgi:hypothetical protein
LWYPKKKKKSHTAAENKIKNLAIHKYNKPKNLGRYLLLYTGPIMKTTKIKSNITAPT